MDDLIYSQLSNIIQHIRKSKGKILPMQASNPHSIPRYFLSCRVCDFYSHFAGCTVTGDSKVDEPAGELADAYSMMNGWSSVETNKHGPIEYFFASDARLV